jgi:hypothetical protein
MKIIVLIITCLNGLNFDINENNHSNMNSKSSPSRTREDHFSHG